MADQTAQEKADASAAWLAQNRPDLVSTPATSAAQAAQINSDYLANRLPVVPQYAAGGGAQYTAAEIADAQSEAAKYAYFNAPIDMSQYANVPLNQMPANVASRVQDYYAAHPSAAAQDITSKYNANIGTVSTGGASYRQGSFTPTVEAGAGGFTGRAADYAKNFVPLSTTLDTQNTRAVQQGQLGIDYASVSGLSNPFNPNSAAGISWDVAKTGGTVGLSLAAAALPEFVKAGVSEVPKSWVSADTGISTVPTPVLDTSKWFRAPVTGTTIPGQDMYFRIGDTGKTQLKENAKMVYADSGAFDLLQVVPNNLPGSNFTRIYPWITAGGSDNALQGSAVTGKPLVTIDGKQSNALVYDEYGLNKMWDTNTVEGSIANQILSGIGTYSKAGRELYGGTVQPVDNRTMQSEFEKGNLVMPGVYSPAIQSYANLVTVAAENAPKGTISSEANLPKFGEIGAVQFASMPAIQKVDLSGKLSSVYASFLPIESQVPTPFKSTSTTAAAIPVGSSFSLENVRESTMGQAPWLFEGLAEVGVWVGSIDLLNPVKTGVNIGTNINLDIQSTKSYSGAIAHAQAHETGFFNRETLIYGNTDTDQLLSTVKGGYGYVSGAIVPEGATAVAHTHTEPLPFLNALNLYSPVASAEDLSGASIKRDAGIAQESVITKSGVLTYATPSIGELLPSGTETYRSETAFGGVFGASNATQQKFLETTGTKYNVTPAYVPLSGKTLSIPVNGNVPSVVSPIGEATIKAPFVSARYTAPSEAATVKANEEYAPSGFLGLGGLLPEIPTYERTQAYAVNLLSRAESNPVTAPLTLMQEEFAAPASSVGGVASRLSLELSEYVYKPTPIIVDTGKSSSTKTEMFNLPITKSINTTNLPETSTISGGNQTITDLGNWLTGNKGSIDLTNKTAVGEYNTKVDLFTQMQKQNPTLITTIGGTKTLTTESGGTKEVITTTGESGQKVYASEWDKFVEGSGKVARWLTGETLAKQEAYKTTLSGDTSVIGEAKRGLFTIGTTVINKPAELAPAAVLGYELRGAAIMVPGFLGEVAAGSGVTARAAQFLETSGGASLAKAGLVGLFGSIYTYDVTNKLTATPEQTKTNIYSSVPALTATYAGAGGLNWLGETRVVRGESAPSGATFSGVNIYDTYFGGGRTPTGTRYAGAFSPTESYVVAGNTPAPSVRTVPLGLPDLSAKTGYASADIGGVEKPIITQLPEPSLIDRYPKVQEGYTRVGHVTTATPELIKSAYERGLKVNTDLAHTSVDLTGQAPSPIRNFENVGATPETWVQAAKNTYLNPHIGARMMGDYSSFGEDILFFDVKTTEYTRRAESGKPFYTGKYIGKTTRSELAQIDTQQKPDSITASADTGRGWEKPAQLPDLANTATTKASTLTESAEPYTHMDLSGRSTPFSVRTDSEVASESLSKFRDTSGASPAFSVKTQFEAAPKPVAEPKVSQVVGDFSGKAQTFSVKTSAEVKSGYWDTTELIGGDVSGKANTFSVKTEGEYLSGLPRDVSGKGKPFAIRTQGEILADWEQERTNYIQSQANLQWAREAARGNVRPGQDLSNRRVEPGFMDTIIDTDKYLTLASEPKVSWKEWKPESGSIVVQSNELLPPDVKIEKTLIEIAKTQTSVGNVEKGYLFDLGTGEIAGSVKGTAYGISKDLKIDMLGKVPEKYGTYGFAYFHTHPDLGNPDDLVKNLPSKLDLSRQYYWSRLVPEEGIVTSDNIVKWSTKSLPSYKINAIDRLSKTLDDFVAVGKRYGLNPEKLPIDKPLKRGYAPAPERIPFTIKGASETALRAELANINPDLMDQALGLRSGSSLATSIEDRGYHYTEIERQALARERTSEGALAIPLVSGLVATQISPRSTGKVTTVTPSSFDSIVETATPSSRSTAYIVPYETTTPTEITTPYSKTTEITAPYSITTPTERIIPDVTPTEWTYPWKQTTETGKPSEIITPVPPLVITPLIPTSLPSLGGGGGSSGSKNPWRTVQRELFYIGPKKVVMKRPKMPKIRRKK